MKREDSHPHDGSVLAGALHLQFVDDAIRAELRKMVETSTIHLLWDKLQSHDAKRVLTQIMTTSAPIPHPLRVMLATFYDIECPLTDKI